MKKGYLEPGGGAEKNWHPPRSHSPVEGISQPHESLRNEGSKLHTGFPSQGTCTGRMNTPAPRLTPETSRAYIQERPRAVGRLRSKGLPTNSRAEAAAGKAPGSQEKDRH